jgi:adenylate kinase family enzyme
VSDLPKRIHFTGGPGSGKSWLAQRLAKTMGVDYIDVDGRMLAIAPLDAIPTMPHEFEAAIALRDVDLDRLTEPEAWVCDGSYIGVSKVALERADLVVWMDAPWRVASYRIVARHVKAELRRNNRFPGWRRLYDFWRWSRRFYLDKNPHRLNAYGTPHTRAFTREALRPYESKLLTVRSKRDVRDLLRRFGENS